MCMRFYLKSFGNGRKLFLFVNMNAKAGSVKAEGVDGKWGVKGLNENGLYLLDICGASF